MRERQIKGPVIFSTLLPVREEDISIISEAGNLTVLYNIFVGNQNSVMLKNIVASGERNKTKNEMVIVNFMVLNTKT